jgi:tetratricopeptide (TPR) repeat protein
LPKFLQPEIERGWDLINDGKRDDTLELINDIEKREKNTVEERLRDHIIIANLIFYLGELKRALNMVDEIYKECQKLGYFHLSLDIVNLKLTIFYNQGTQGILELSLSEIKRGESIITSFSDEDRVIYGRKEAKFLQLKALTYMIRRKDDLALDCFKDAQKFNNKFDQNELEVKILKKHLLENLAIVYYRTDEFDTALKYYNQSLSLNVEDERSRILLDGHCLRGMGFMYYRKGDLDSAINYYKQAITIYEDIKLNVGFILHDPKFGAYSGIISNLMTKGDVKLAQYYLRKFKQLVNSSPTKDLYNVQYPLARVRFLKNSTRIRDLVEAENILKEILEKNKYLPAALSQICDLYLRELNLTSDFTILDDINTYITMMLEIAENKKHYALLARTKLFQAKISLIRMNMGDARQFLTQAQKIADEHGYGFLAKAISIEHDNLLEQLDKWEGLKKGNAPASERIKLASVDKVIEYLVESGNIETPEVHDEQPVVLLIIGEGGILLFSFAFTDAWKFDEELFSGFLTAFNSISDEVFAEGLDRVKFGKHTVLMEPVANFSVCYLFKGGTYIAKQKLTKFANHLQKNTSIQQTLDKFLKVNQVLEIKDFPFLESLINEIFLIKEPELKI